MPRGSLKDLDKGWRKAVESMAEAARRPGAHVVVGWPERTGGLQHPESDLTIAEIAEINEFGAGRTPERSMIRATCDQNREKYERVTRALALRVAIGTMPIEHALDTLGVLIKGDVQQRINAGIAPPNAPSTIKRKGSSTPLIDTGVMKGSIDHEVRDV